MILCAVLVSHFLTVAARGSNSTELRLEQKEKTMEEFEDVILAILTNYPRHRWPGDIIDRVFVAIEQNPDYRMRYEEFADGDYATTNQLIGKFVKEHTGMKTGKVADNPKSGLIKTFTVLE
jgi:hypothetical protein